MTIYNKYVVKQGDTLQKIANYELGDISQWVTLRDMNDLEYPYIVATPQLKSANYNHLLTVGDILYLPTFQKDTNVSNINNLTLSTYDREEMYDTTMGRDLKVSLDVNGLFDESDCILDFDSHKGYPDYQTVAGLDNLKQSLILRIFTRQGALVLHPEYGSTFIDYIGTTVDKDNMELAKTELLRAVTSDGRVEQAEADYTFLDYNSVCFDLAVTPVSEDKQIKIYISIMEDGTVTIS